MTAPATESAAPELPPPELVESFARELARLYPEGGRLGLAVSGGPDSVALLLLAQVAMPGRFEVATVDHGLRPASAGECAMVARLCAERGIACEVLSVSVGAGNVQAMAREARYSALREWAERRGLTALATAHHADDQAETLLMRLNRGSGVSGLAGVRGRTLFPGSTLAVIRPLLRFRRAELGAVVASAGIAAVEDPSNADHRFQRVRVRTALAGSEWLRPTAVAASAAHLADADEAIEWAARREWSEQVTMTAAEIRYSAKAPRAVALRVVSRAVAELGGTARGQDIARLTEALEAGRGANVAGVLARANRGEWVFRREPPRTTR